MKYSYVIIAIGIFFLVAGGLIALLPVHLLAAPSYVAAFSVAPQWLIGGTQALVGMALISHDNIKNNLVTILAGFMVSVFWMVMSLSPAQNGLPINTVSVAFWLLIVALLGGEYITRKYDKDNE